MGSSTANNPDMVPTALYPTHSLPDLTPEQLTIYWKNPLLWCKVQKPHKAPPCSSEGDSVHLKGWFEIVLPERGIFVYSPGLCFPVFRHRSCFSPVPEYSSMPFTQGDREPSASLLLLVATCSFPSPHMAAWAGPDSPDKAGLQDQETPNASVTPTVSLSTHRNAVQVMTRSGSAVIKCICPVIGTFRGWAMRIGSKASWVCVKKREEKFEVAEKGVPKAQRRFWDRQEFSVVAPAGHQTTHPFIKEARRGASRLRNSSARQWGHWGTSFF